MLTKEDPLTMVCQLARLLDFQLRSDTYLKKCPPSTNIENGEVYTHYKVQIIQLHSSLPSSARCLAHSVTHYMHHFVYLKCCHPHASINIDLVDWWWYTISSIK